MFIIIETDKSQIPFMTACSATGHYIPLMLIFPGQCFSYNPLEGFEEAALRRLDSRWIDSKVFFLYLAPFPLLITGK